MAAPWQPALLPLLLAGWCWGAGGTLWADPPPAPRRVAVLVGIDSYLKPDFGTLETCEADASSVAHELELLQFDTVRLLRGREATRKQILQAIEEEVLPLGKQDLALILLSGHGQQFKFREPDPDHPDQQREREDAFFCPFDAVSRQPSSLVSLSELIDDILARNVGRRLLLVDACRNAPRDRNKGTRGPLGKGIQGGDAILLPEETAVFFSCKAGEQSWTHPELPHSLFTQCVVEALQRERNNGQEVTWAGLVKEVQDQMEHPSIQQLIPSGATQTPIVAGVVSRTVLGRDTLPRQLTNSQGLPFVRIDPGEFLMGSPATDPDAFEGERPAHRVRITRPFYLGRHEVTKGEFAAFVAATGYRTEAEQDGRGGFGLDADGRVSQQPSYTWRQTGFPQDDSHPVVNVSWNDAVRYLDWLQQEDGQEHGRRYRLPTEAEWEYACRAGSTTRFNFGDEAEAIIQHGNVADGSLRSRFRDWKTLTQRDGRIFTAPVGKYSPNAWGLHDMHGNVWEWTADWYDRDSYRNSPASDPPGPSTGTDRTFRGGGWNNLPNRLCRSAYRFKDAPSYRNSNLGFRVAWSPQPAQARSKP